MRILTLVALTALSVQIALSQARFEVSSVKAVEHAAGQPYGSENISAHPGSLTMRNVRLRACIKWAYGVREYQIAGPASLGSPGWMAVDRYDVIAKAPGETPVAELRVMLQTLLVERFKLAVHREEREVPSYALVLVKAGPNLHASDSSDAGVGMNAKGSALSIRKISMPEFAEFLSGPMGVPVMDETKLEGRFDLNLDTAPYAPATRDDEEAAMITAIREQLGLRLERRKSPIQMLVVDRVAAAPTEN